MARPRSLSVADLKARERHEVEFTLECSGNNGTGLALFIGGIGNARWAGARLAPLLEQAAILDDASEVIFWGADSGKVTVRDNSGVVGAGRTGMPEPDATGGLDLTFTEQFARSMSLREALSRDNILCYEMNGQPLPPEHGFPVRLIAPGWYGVANGRGPPLRRQVHGPGLRHHPRGTMGAPIVGIQVQVDNGSWMPASLDVPATARSRSYGWRFWTVEWGTPQSGRAHRAFPGDRHRW